MLEYAARHTELGVIAITDHDTIDGAMEACGAGEENGSGNLITTV
jgi:predicted metal-dependent phosphoesterase TrpH